MIIMSYKQARQFGIQPLFRIIGYSDVCRDPMEAPIAPADAIRLAIHNANHFNKKSSAGSSGNISLQDISFHEINEAFSVVPIANARFDNSVTI